MITLILDTRINLTLGNEEIKQKISKESTQIVHLLRRFQLMIENCKVDETLIKQLKQYFLNQT